MHVGVAHPAGRDRDHRFARTRVGHVDGHHLDWRTLAAGDHATDLLCHACPLVAVSISMMAMRPSQPSSRAVTGQLHSVEGFELGGSRLVGQVEAVRTGQGHPSPESVISQCSATRSQRGVSPATHASLKRSCREERAVPSTHYPPGRHSRSRPAA